MDVVDPRLLNRLKMLPRRLLLLETVDVVDERPSSRLERLLIVESRLVDFRFTLLPAESASMCDEAHHISELIRS